jgi:hypothetical protein
MIGLEMVWPWPMGSGHVLVGARGDAFVDEDVARDLGHRAEHALVHDALAAQQLDHAHARALGGHADAVARRSLAHPLGDQRDLRGVREVDLQRRDRHGAALERVEIGSRPASRAAPAGPTQ